MESRWTETEAKSPPFSTESSGYSAFCQDLSTEVLFFWEAYLSIKVPLTRLDPVRPIDAEPPQPLKETSSWFDRGPRPGAIRTATM